MLKLGLRDGEACSVLAYCRQGYLPNSDKQVDSSARIVSSILLLEIRDWVQEKATAKAVAKYLQIA
jgi:hypothetical protein